MNRTEMEALLKKLQAELASGQAVDDELRASLRQLDQDIVRALGSGSPLADGDSEESLAQRAQEIDARFSAEHPYLAATLRDVMDLLGKMGI
jgi:hypothetical protein